MISYKVFYLSMCHFSHIFLPNFSKMWMDFQIIIVVSLVNINKFEAIVNTFLSIFYLFHILSLLFSHSCLLVLVEGLKHQTLGPQAIPNIMSTSEGLKLQHFDLCSYLIKRPKGSSYIHNGQPKIVAHDDFFVFSSVLCSIITSCLAHWMWCSSRHPQCSMFTLNTGKRFTSLFLTL